MQTVDKNISELIPAEYNPRQLSEKQAEDLKASMQRFDAMEPAIVNTNEERENIIISGHQRIKVAKQLGWKVYPCVEVDLDRDQERELNIRMNKNTGSWDWDLLANYFDQEELTDWGFTEEELFGEWDSEEAEEDNYEVPNEDDIETDIQEGDLIDIGKHRLLCGDATDESRVSKLLEGEKIDMIFTDPPYGLGGYGGRKGMDLQNDDGNEDMIASFYSLPIYYECSDVYIWGNAINLFKHIMHEPRDVIVWKKNNFGLGRGYRGQYELCFYYGDFNGSDSDVWEVDKDIEYKHPTQKPIALCERAINNSKPETVADFFMGSGSTMVASHQLNRRCYGMELDPKYCQVIIDRMQELDPELEIKINGEVYS